MCLTKPGVALKSSEQVRRKRFTTARLSSNQNSNMVPIPSINSNVNIITDSSDEDTRAHSPTPRKVLVEKEYHDFAYERDPAVDGDELDDDTPSHKRRGPRGGVSHPFPEKLHIMLEEVEKDGLDHIVSWHSHGRSFAVHKPKEFVADIMPHYFKQTKLTSFQRQLNLYGFSRLTTGNDRGGYYHELFLRHRLFLCDRMMRTRIKGTGTKAAMNPDTEPDFYAMPIIKPLSETPRKPPSAKTTWKVTFEQKQPSQKKKKERKSVSKPKPSPSPPKQLHRRVSLAASEEDFAPPPKVQSMDIDYSSFEPPMVQSSSSEPQVLPIPRPSSFPSVLPLVMPVLPKTVGVDESSPVITPPHTPMQEDDTVPPPPVISDSWMLSDSSPLDEPLVFEGKTFHFLDATSFDCLHEDRGTVQEMGVSLKDADEFLAGIM